MNSGSSLKGTSPDATESLMGKETAGITRNGLATRIGSAKCLV